MTLDSEGWLRQWRMMRLQQLQAALVALPPLERLGELVRHADWMPPSSWLQLMGAVWPHLPRVSGWEELLLTRTPLAHSPWPVVEMMDADELAAYVALPDVFLAYRGALAHNHAGLCWSLEMACAAGYADRYAQRFIQCGHARPLAYQLTARIDKSQVIAVKRVEGQNTLLVAQVDYLATEVLPVHSAVERMPSVKAA